MLLIFAVADMLEILLISPECYWYVLNVADLPWRQVQSWRFIGLKLDGPKLGGPLTTEIEQDDIERSFEPVWTVIRLNEFYGPDMGIGFEKNA